MAVLPISKYFVEVIDPCGTFFSNSNANDDAILPRVSLLRYSSISNVASQIEIPTMVILGGHNRVAQRARIAQNNEEDCLESARMVLPFILRHNSLLRQQQLKNQEKREDKPCVELHLPRIFLTRTIGNIEATAMRSTRPAALKRKPDVVPVSLSEMKDFMCLIGKILLNFVLIQLPKLLTVLSFSEWQKTTLFKVSCVLMLVKSWPIPTCWPWCLLISFGKKTLNIFLKLRSFDLWKRFFP